MENNIRKTKKNYVKFIELFGFTSFFFLVCNFFMKKKIRPTVEMIDEALLSFCDIEWFDKKTFDDDMFWQDLLKNVDKTSQFVIWKQKIHNDVLLLLTSNGIFLEEKHSLEDGKNWAEQKIFKTSNLEREKIEHSCIYYIFGESWWWWCPWRSQTNYIIVSMKFLKGQDSMYLLHFLDWPF